MFLLTISKLQLCFEWIAKNALSAFWPSQMKCYFLIICSLASNQKGSYLTESQAELHVCICPTQQHWCSTATSRRSSQGCLSRYHEHGGFVLWKSWLQKSTEQLRS